MVILALVGLADSLYLTWYHYDPAVRVCLATSGCEVVNTSPYAVVGPVPVAVVGAAGYLQILSALVLRRWDPPPLHRAAARAVYALAVLGSGFAIYLTAVEIFVLHALCGWCLLSAAAIVAICAVAALEAPGP
jgi:uncharacterized membrane protein